MFAALAAVLAVAGASPSTPFICHQQRPMLADGAVVNAYAVLGPSGRIEMFGPYGCAALWYAGASVADRRRIDLLNRKLVFSRVVGVGLLLDLHEAFHIGLQSDDECLVEKRAFATLPGLLFRFFRVGFVAEALQYALFFDEGLPAAYHGC